MRRYRLSKDGLTGKPNKPRNHDEWTGKYLPGNDAAKKRGNPMLRRVLKLRQASIKVVSERMLKNMLKEVVANVLLTGDVKGFCAVWDRVVGKPVKSTNLERVEVKAAGDEMARQSQAHAIIKHQSKGPVRRVRILSDRLIEDFSLLIGEGLPTDAVCDTFGITHERFANWWKEGARLVDGDELPDELDEQARLCGELVLRVRQALAGHKHRLLKAAQQERQGITLLERRDRRTFGRLEAEAPIDTTEPDEKYL